MAKTTSKSMIIGDAILPQTSKNDQKCGSEFVALLWRHLTPQRKKTQYRCTTTSLSGAKQPKRYFRKFTFSMTFGAHKCSFRATFWTTCTNFYTCCQRYSDKRKKLYRCTSAFLSLSYCCWFLFINLSYLYDVVRTNFCTDFWSFCNFWPQFRENCGAAI